MGLVTALFYIVFVLSAIVLITVILLQEGKGGGLGQALGGAGQETFGVGASGINKFTGVIAFVFLASSIVIHMTNRSAATSSVLEGTGLEGAFGGEAPAVTAPPAAGTEDGE